MGIVPQRAERAAGILRFKDRAVLALRAYNPKGEP